MKICVLGNSHVASLKLGLAKLPVAQKNVSVDFFASRANSLRALRLEKNRLMPMNVNLAKAISHTSGGKGEITLDEYDAFLVYGLGFPLPLVQKHLSSAVRRQVCRDTVEQTLSFRTCLLLRQGTDKPVYVGHDPQPSARGVDPDLSRLLPYDEVYGMMKIELSGTHLLLTAQPRQTLADTWFTKSEFSKGSVRLDIGDEKSSELHGDVDNKHMNGEFGRLWLESFFRDLGAKAETGAR